MAEPVWEETYPVFDETLSVNRYPISKSAALGFSQGATMGFADEGAAAIAGSGRDIMAMRFPTIASYRSARNKFRREFSRAFEENPKTYYGSEFAGGAATAMIPGTQGITVPKLVAIGAGQGLGASEADLIEGDFSGAARDAVIGGVSGAVLGKYALPITRKIVGGAAKFPKKVFSAILGPSEESIDAYLKNPQSIKNAKTYAELAEDLPETLGKLSKQIKREDSLAWGMLRTSHDFDEGAIPKKEIVKMINRVKLDPKITGGGTFGKASKNAVAALNNLIDDLKTVGERVPGKIKSVMGVSSNLRNKDYISESQLKELIQSADDNIRWDDPTAGPLNSAFKEVRTTLDNLLKSQNKNYANAMEPVARKTNLFQKMRRAFNVREETGKGLLPTDQTAGKIELAPGEKKIASQDILGELNTYTGRDYLSESKTRGIARQFEGGRPQGSRNVNVSAVLGTGLGYGIGSATGLPLAGSLAGTVAGGMTGAYIDRKGGEIAADVLDKYISGKMKISALGSRIANKIPNILKQTPQKFGKYAPLLRRASRLGTQQLMIQHWLLMDEEPGYKETIGNLEGN